MVWKYLKSKENQILMRFDVSWSLSKQFIILVLVFEHISRRAKIDFYPPQVVPEGQKSIIGYSKRLPKTSNRIKIWFSFDLRYFQTTTIDTNLCKLLKTELVRYGLFLYKFNLYRFLSLVSCGASNYHKSEVNQILKRFDVS